MCVAVVLMDEDRPTLDELQRMEWQNDDGAGVGWYEGGVCHWVKGIKAESVDKLIETLPRPVFIHFRYSTAGGTRPELCHPFPVTRAARLDLSGEAKSILMHNGHWSKWTQVAARRQLPKGPWSDTRLLAWLARRDVRWLAREADDYGKVAHMTKDGEVMLYGKWEKEGGIYYSNTYWRAKFKWGELTDSCSVNWDASYTDTFDSDEEYAEWLNAIYEEYRTEKDPKKRAELGEELAAGYMDFGTRLREKLDADYREELGPVDEEGEPFEWPQYPVKEYAADVPDIENYTFGEGPYDFSDNHEIVNKFLLKQGNPNE